MLLGAFTAVLLALCVWWGVYGLNRLWVAHLERRAGGEFRAAAVALGLVPKPQGYQPRLWAVGQLRDLPACLELRGGLRGELVRLRVGKSLVEAHLCDIEEDLTSWAQRSAGAEVQ